MTSKISRRLALGAGASTLAAGAMLPARAQTSARLKIQTAVPSSSIYFDLLKRFADRADKMSNGRLKLEMLPDGAVVSAFEIMDAVDKGVSMAATHGRTIGQARTPQPASSATRQPVAARAWTSSRTWPGSSRAAATRSSRSSTRKC